MAGSVKTSQVPEAPAANVSDYAFGESTSGPVTNRWKWSAILTMIFANFPATLFSVLVANQANAGSAGGTIYYVNLFGIKLAWGRTGTISVAGGQQATATVTFPTAFFSSIQTILTSLTGEAVETKLRAGANSAPTTTSVVLEIVTTTGTNAPGGTSGTIDWFVIGT